MKQSEHRFPCIGAECAAAGTWHEAGAVCRAYRDAVRYDGKKCAWQRMCEGCADAGARLWTPSPSTTFASAGPAWDDVDDEEMERQVADAEAEFNAGRALAELPPPPSPPPPPLPARLAAAAHPLAAAAHPTPIPHASARPMQPPPPPPRLVAPPPQPPPPLISHEDERLKLGKPLWAAIAARIPRPQHDGTLAYSDAARRAERVDLEALASEFSALPYVTPPPAEARARALLAGAGSAPSEELKQSVRACFECEAAGIDVAVCIPEVVAREELMAEARFHVKREDGSIAGVKCCCTSCGSNAFVLIDALNVNNKSRVRFAYGDKGSTMPVALDYICVNPDDPAVQRKLSAAKLDELRTLTAHGLQRALDEQKVAVLKPLGVRFSGLDHELILSLPPRARAVFRGLTFFEHEEHVDDEEGGGIKHVKVQGGCNLALAERLVSSKANLSEIAAELSTAADARQKDLYARYVSFASRFLLSGGVSTASAEPPPPELIKACYSARCLSRLLPRAEFSKKQWERKDADADRRCSECIDDKIALHAPATFGADTSTATVQTFIPFEAAAMTETLAATTGTLAATTGTLAATMGTLAATTEALAATEAASAPLGSVLWPAWRLPKMSASLLHPTALNLRSILIALHRQLEPWLLGDMVRRSPGKGASSDGTFRLMMRTRTDGKVLLLIIGDDHTVTAWYVCRSESWNELLPALLFLRARLERLGTLHMLAYWWSDLCCHGATDVTQHVLCTIFPSVKRAPYRDCFHAINAVNKTGHEGLPDEKSELGSDLFDALREIPEAELTPPVAWLRKSRRLDESKARAVALATFRRDGIIRNRSHATSEQVRRWRAVRDKWEARKALAQGRRERCVVRTKTAVQQGTLEEMDAVGRCVAKGCCVDPMAMEDMYMETRVQPKTGLQERLRMGDTNRNEVRHRSLNEIVEHVARMGADLMHVELSLKLFLTNKHYDKLLGRIDEFSLGCFPWDDTELNGMADGVLAGPPLFFRAANPFNALPELKPVRKGDAEWEPLGFQYLDYLDAMQNERVVAEALEAARAALAVEEEAERALAQQQCEDEAMAELLDGCSEAVVLPAVASPIDAPAIRDESEIAPPLLDVRALALPATVTTPPQSGRASSSASPALPAMATTPPRSGRASSSASPELARQGAATVSGAQKTMRVTPALAPVIEVTSEAELQLAAEVMTAAINEGCGVATMAMYDRAAALWTQRLVVLFGHPTSSPPDGLRYGRVTGDRLKAAAERCTTSARQVAREREYRGVAAVDDADWSGPSATAIAALIEMAAEPTAAPPDGSGSLAPDRDDRRLQKVVNRARRNHNYLEKAKQDIFTITLAELQDGNLTVAAPRLKRIAKIVGVRVKTTADYKTADMRQAVVAAMSAASMHEVTVS